MASKKLTLEEALEYEALLRKEIKAHQNGEPTTMKYTIAQQELMRIVRGMAQRKKKAKENDAGENPNPQ